MAEYVEDRSVKISDTVSMYQLDSGDVVITSIIGAMPMEPPMPVVCVVPRADLWRVADRLLNSHVWNGRNLPKAPRD